MLTYKITLDDTPKAKLLIEMLKEMAFVKSIEPSPEADVTTFAKEGEPMLFEDFANMILEAEKQVKEGKTYSSAEVRKMLKK
jgi:wyosine [tRNA(Phe)-imidazoG37] synthetase (radical SAM superfamily)